MNSGVLYNIFESQLMPTDQFVTQLEIPFYSNSSNTNDLPTKIIIIATSDQNYSGTFPLWVDNFKLLPFEIEITERVAVSCPNSSTAWICFQDPIQPFAYINSYDINSETIAPYTTLDNPFLNTDFNLYSLKMEFVASPYRNDVFYYGGAEIKKLENYTENDIHGNLHVDIRALSVFDYVNGQERIIVGTDGGIVVSNDGGNTWIDINGKLPITQFYGLGFEENNSQVIAAGCLDNGTFRVENGIGSIIKEGDGGNSKIQNGIIYHQSNWSFSSNSSGSITVPHWGLNMPLEITNEAAPNVFIGGRSILYKTNAFFGSIITDTLNGKSVTAIGIQPTNQNLIYLAKGGVPDDGFTLNINLYISTDKGDNWTLIPDPLDAVGNSIYENFFVSDFTFDPDNENRVWCSTKGNSESISDIHSKVFYSDDYGQTWTDLSINNGLPPFSVNTITRQNGSDDILYAGTDVGVFYCEGCDDPQTAQWNCYNNELPPCIVTDLKINYCQNKLYASTFGRAIWNVDLIKTEKVVSSDATWSQPVKLLGDLRITSGTTLVVNSIIDVPENCKIIVENKAHLYLNGGTLSNSCGSMWNGVEVWGNSTSAQPTDQGRFTAINNSLIEHSINGIQTYALNASGSEDINTTGAIIRCSNSTFRNNKTSAKFYPYTAYLNGNLSRFDKCNFIIDGELNDKTLLPSEQVLLVGVRNVNFYGCKFENTRVQGSFPLSDRGKGIRSFSSIFKVLPFNLTRSEFAGLYRGIEANSAIAFNTFMVRKAKFTNNTRGILAGGVDYATIIENEFIIPELQSLEVPYGVYMNYCKDYEIENNTFTSTNANFNAGLAINNSGDSPNRIYNNSFDNIYAGQLLMGDNRSVTGNGLQVLCNVNSSNEYDAALTAQGEIAFNQGAFGTQSSPAGNLFSHSCISGDNDYFAQSSPSSFVYWSHDNIPPICYSIGNITVNPAGQIYDASNRDLSCPPELSINTSPIIHRSLFGYFKNLYTERILLIDGGNTQTVLNYLNANNSPGHIKNYLMDLSPYLSDEVLMKAIDKNIPAGHIKQILLANSPLSVEVLTYFIQTSYPTGIKNQVQNAQEGVSERSKLYAELSNYDSEKSKAAGDYIRHYLLVDTTTSAPDSIKVMLSLAGYPDPLCKKAAFDIHSGDLVSASTHVSDLNAIDPDDAFCKLLNVLLELEQTIEKCYSITPPQKEKLEAIAEEHDKEACKNAQALLELVFNISFPETIEFPVEYRSIQVNDNLPLKVTSNENIKVYPNPTSSDIFIEFEKALFDNSSKLTIKVNDITGKQLMTRQVNHQWESLDISILSTGIYVITIENNGIVIDKQKVIKE